MQVGGGGGGREKGGEGGERKGGIYMPFLELWLEGVNYEMGYWTRFPSSLTIFSGW